MNGGRSLRSRLADAGRALLLVAVTFAAYTPALTAGYIWDDDDYVTENRLLHEPDGLQRIWLGVDLPSQYFPLTYTAFRLEYSLWGLDPFGYHLVNVALHAANALLVVWALKRLRARGAWLAGALFALHPMHVESVAWVTELKNVLSLHFFLWALHAWLGVLAPGPRPRRGALYALTLVAYALALFAKTTACTFPAAQLLTAWLRGRRIDARLALSVVPFVAMGLAMGGISILVERVHQGTDADVFSASFLERCIIASRALAFYLQKLVWPHPLIFSYPKFPVDAANAFHYAWGVGGAALLGLLIARRRRDGPAPLAATLWFVAMLSPLIGFIGLFTFRYAYVADHYVYVASLGPLALFAEGVTRLAQRRPPATRRLVFGAMAVLLGVLGLLTFRQARTYENQEVLWRDVIAKVPDSWMAHGNLGRELLHTGRAAEALEAYRAALRSSPLPHFGFTGAGIALAQLGREDEALESFELALAHEPRYAPALDQLGKLRQRRGELAEAERAFALAYGLTPSPERWRALLSSRIAAGRGDETVADLRNALERDPTDAWSRERLLGLLVDCSANRVASGATIDWLDLARAHFAASHTPQSGALLAAALAAEGSRERAIELLQRLLKQAPQGTDPLRIAALRRQLTSYERGLEYCEPPAAPEPGD